MSKYIQIHWTAGSLNEARIISRKLVQEGLVACASIIPWVESIFTWNGELETCQETKVIFKTSKELFERTKNKILEEAKYEVPEILEVPITDGHKEYLDWVSEKTSQLI
ncbi:MAG: divalent-cation tolerance protein CutA [Chlamydiales bacterium]